jgi:cytochrome c oxidase subunit 2
VFVTANEMHVPVGRPVLMTLRSNDVIHSLWLPSLGGKKDLIPGRETTHVLRADRPSEHRGPCAEFCGAQHTAMVLSLIAEPADRYEAWAERQRAWAPKRDEPQIARGRELFVNGACALCHAIAGTAASAQTGPDLTHIASRRRIAGVLPNTAEAMRSWIADPQRHKPGANMPAYPLPADELQALVAFLGTLQ